MENSVSQICEGQNGHSRLPQCGIDVNKKGSFPKKLTLKTSALRDYRIGRILSAAVERAKREGGY
jgi:hypothetical protein